MKPFRYEQAQDAASAVALVSQAAHAGYLAGGTNLVDHLKLGVSQPDVLVDITHLPYGRIEALPDGGVRIELSSVTPTLQLTCSFAKSFLSLLRPCSRGLRDRFAIRRRLEEISYSGHAASTFRTSPSPAISVNPAAVVPLATAIIAAWRF